MINVNQITSELASKSDKGLQDYATINKNDPYLVALALSESNRRKHLRTAALAAQAGQQQPKVVDQDIAQMAAPQLPEDSGIAQLPAPNMQGMAGGGIVAFEEGGEVPRFNGQYGSVPMSYSEQLRNLGEFFNPVTRFRQLVSDPSLRSEKAAPAAAAFEIPESTFTGTGSTEEVDKLATDMAAPVAAAAPQQKASPLQQLLPGAGKVGTASDKAGMPALFQTEKLPDKAEYTKEYDELYKALDEKQGKFLENQKSKLKTDREEALYMAMIKGGLAAAAGTSKNALQNLAQGFGQGAEDFNASLKDFRRAAQETAKMEVEMERAQADRKAGRMDKYDARVEKVQDRALERDKALLAANTQLQAARETAGAHIKAAQMPGAQERLFATLGGGDVVKGLKLFQEAQTDKTGAAYAKLYSDYAANADKSGADKMSPVEFAQNMQQFMSAMQGGGFQSKPTTDNVRRLPGT